MRETDRGRGEENKTWKGEKTRKTDRKGYSTPKLLIIRRLWLKKGIGRSAKKACTTTLLTHLKIGELWTFERPLCACAGQL